MTYQDVVEAVARKLFDIWKEAKESSEDSWGGVTFDSLPEKYKHEYYLTAKRILSLQVDNLMVAVIEKESTLPDIENYCQLIQGYSDYSGRMSGYRDGQHMLKQGWHKVVKE